MSTIPVNSTVTLNDYIQALSTTDNDTSAYIPVSNNSTLKKMQISKITQSLSVATTNANGMMSSEDKTKLNNYPISTVSSTTTYPRFVVIPAAGTKAVHSDASNVNEYASDTHGGLMSSGDKTKLNNYPNSTVSTVAYPRFIGVLANGTVTTLGHAGQADLVANSQHGGLMTSSMYNTLMNSTKIVSVSGAGLAPDIPDTQTTYDHPRFLAATAMSSSPAWYHSDIQAFSVSTVHGGFVPRVNRISTAANGSTSINEDDWIYTHRNGQNLAQWRSLAYLGLTTADATASAHGYMTAADKTKLNKINYLSSIAGASLTNHVLNGDGDFEFCVYEGTTVGATPTDAGGMAIILRHGNYRHVIAFANGTASASVWGRTYYSKDGTTAASSWERLNNTN